MFSSMLGIRVHFSKFFFVGTLFFLHEVLPKFLGALVCSLLVFVLPRGRGHQEGG